MQFGGKGSDSQDGNLALEWETEIGYLCTSRGTKGELRQPGEESTSLLKLLNKCVVWIQSRADVNAEP